MSKTAKIAIWVIVIVVVVGGGLWWWSASMNNGSTAMQTTPVTETTPTTPTAPAATPTSTAPSGGTLTTGSDTSNAALSADLSQVDGQMNAMSGDNASINQGLNDQPVQQQQF